MWLNSLRLLFPALLCVVSCAEDEPKQRSESGALPIPAHFFPTDFLERKQLFHRYLDSGNRFYGEKAGYASFQKSLPYFDSARAVARHMGDTLYLSTAVFVQAQIYDAWNKEPLKTIQYYREAAELTKTLPNHYSDYIYGRHLVAHAYAKARDTAGAARQLRELYPELALLSQASRDSLEFLAESALIASEVGAYSLADSILDLSRRAAIANASYNSILDHYYLTQSRLDVYWRKLRRTPYLDSLTAVYRASTNLMDSAFYSERLAGLYAAVGDSARAYAFFTDYQRMHDSLEDPDDIAAMQQALVQSEVANELSRVKYEDRLHTMRWRTVWALAAALVIITVLAGYLYRRSRQLRAQSQRLASTNASLDDKVTQVELLNKEIQHRVKNNLHMVYSLLQMQERRTDNEETAEQLQAARLRVESIAALHNLLLGGREGVVDFGSYTRSLVSSVVACLSGDRKVVTHFNTEGIHIPPNSYFALSLVLNEWVTNSVKYAATADDSVEIQLHIRNEADAVCIDYSDNGTVPPPSRGEAGASPGLGTQIVNLLTRQMSATLTTPPGRPYHYNLSIPHRA